MLSVPPTERFTQRLEEYRKRAAAWLDLSDSEAKETAREVWTACAHLALAPDILALFAEEIGRRVAGEARTAKLLYLAPRAACSKSP